MNDTNRLLLAMGLCLAVMAAWQVFYAAPAQKERQAYYAAQEKKAKETAALTQPKAPETPKIAERGEVLQTSSEARIRIQSSRLHGSIALKGARFDDLTLADYKISLEKGSPEVVLLSPQGATDTYFVDLGWLGNDNSLTLPDKDTVWQSADTELTPEKPVTFTWKNPEGVVFTRTISLDKNFLFTVSDSISNATSKEITLFPYGLINRTRPDVKSYAVSHEGVVGVYGDVLEEHTYDELHKRFEKKEEDGKFTFSGNGGWMGIADKYWLTAMIPQQANELTATAQYYVNTQGQKRYQVHYRGAAQPVKAGETITLTRQLFAGAKEVELLDAYGEQLNIPLFDRAVDFGALYFLTRPIFTLLDYLYGFLGNFGVAIIVLTIFIKLLLFPLANKSYKSMARLKEHMPEMMKIKERYSHDKMKLNQEMMKFYSENRINPMSGCLPLLLQLPIFFAIYKVIFITIEMRHAPFIWWIKDLSAQDTTNILNLFGLLPFTPPLWLPQIGALALMFAITMAIQQRLSPPPTDPTQKMVMRLMPWVLVFLFASFPAGLLVYWVWSNILSIIQQYIITRHIHKHKEA